MNKELKEILKTAALDSLAERAGITAESLQKSQQVVAMQMQPSAMPPAMPPTQPMPNQMQRPMNVRPADPRRMANMQNIKQALETDSQLDNLAMMRMQKKARGGAALEDFAGQVPGEGHGMQDNVYMPIVDKGDQVATLAVSPDEYVVDAHTMSALGNGSADEGAKVMDQIVKEVRQEAFGTTQQPDQINGLQSLRDKMIG
tara:strand:- start:410 stop:1012 length:603 start_codon:yes stop_codon:yes gene_type:complete